MSDPRVPKELDAIADVVLRYKPKAKTKGAKKRKKRVAKLVSLSGESSREPKQQK